MYNVLDDIPPSGASSNQDKTITFECGSSPFIPTYQVIETDDESERNRKYVLLHDFLRQMKLTRTQFNQRFKNLRILRASRTHFNSYFVCNDFITSINGSKLIANTPSSVSSTASSSSSAATSTNSDQQGNVEMLVYDEQVRNALQIKSLSMKL